jgi:hypothetical protein
VFEVDTAVFSGIAQYGLEFRIQQLASGRPVCERSLAALPTRHVRTCRGYSSLAAPNRGGPEAGGRLDRLGDGVFVHAIGRYEREPEPAPHHTRGRYLGIRGLAEKEGPVRACVATLPRWSGWLYAHQTLWLDPGPDWDEEKVAEFLAMCASS